MNEPAPQPEVVNRGSIHGSPLPNAISAVIQNSVNKSESEQQRAQRLAFNQKVAQYIKKEKPPEVLQVLTLDENVVQQKLEASLGNALPIWEAEVKNKDSEYLDQMCKVRNDLIRVGLGDHTNPEGPFRATDTQLLTLHKEVFQPVWWRYLYAKTLIGLRKLKSRILSFFRR